jgi:hypothetical protein
LPHIQRAHERGRRREEGGRSEDRGVGQRREEEGKTEEKKMRRRKRRTRMR